MAKQDRSDPRLEVIGTVAATLGADAELVEAALDAATARPADRRHIRDHLAEKPDALQSAASDTPPAVARLARELVALEVPGARVPVCARCGRDVQLRYKVDGGRICTNCFAKSNAATCGQCGKVNPVGRRGPGGEPICQACSMNKVPCSRCDRTARVVTRTDTGEPLCPACAPRPTYECSACGETAPAQAIGDDGPVCRECYTEPERACGLCGEVRRIEVRGRDGQPDVCVRCYTKPVPPCRTCGERHDCGHDLPEGTAPMEEPGEERTRLLVRIREAPRQHRPCALCQRSKPVQARWPLGDVCVACYTRAVSTPRSCGQCGRDAVLIGLRDERLCCGPCAGTELDYRCTQCAQPGRMYSRGLCVDCALERRLDELLGPIGEAGTLEQLRAGLLTESNTRAVLRWLAKPAVAAMITALADAQEVTHGRLDELPQLGDRLASGRLHRLHAAPSVSRAGPPAPTGARPPNRLPHKAHGMRQIRALALSAQSPSGGRVVFSSAKAGHRYDQAPATT